MTKALPVPTGKKYGKWTVLGPAESVQYARPDRNGTDSLRKWLCRCECGVERPVYANVLRHGNSTQCADCRYRGRTPLNQFFYNRFKRGAKSRGLAWRITLKQFRSTFDDQGGRCALTGLALVWPERTRDVTFGTVTASLDRIRQAEGYVIDNVQWVHKCVNMLKGKRSDAELIHWARLIVSHADSQQRAST